MSRSLASTVEAFVDFLPAFDAGWWSRYDKEGHLASPFYQRLHIAQLTALDMTFPFAGRAIREPMERWQQALSSRPARARAILVKAAQQMTDPPPMIR